MEFWGGGTLTALSVDSDSLLMDNAPHMPPAFNSPMGRALPPVCDANCPAPCLNAELTRSHIAERIKTWRKTEGHCLDSLALKLGVSRNTIHLWEHAKRLPNLSNLLALATAMQCSPCHFFCPLLPASRPCRPTAQHLQPPSQQNVDRNLLP